MILDLSLWNLLRMRIIAEWLACWFSKLWIIGSIPSFFFTNIRLCQLRISSILIMNGRRSYKCPEFTWFAPLKSTASCFKSSQELMKQKGRCPRVKSVRKDGKMTRRGPKGCTTLDGPEDTSGKRKKELWVWDSWKREREKKPFNVLLMMARALRIGDISVLLLLEEIPLCWSPVGKRKNKERHFKMK